MLADTVEAAVRSMPDPTPKTIRANIEKLVSNKIQDGQLSQAPITLSDIDKISEPLLRFSTAYSTSGLNTPIRLSSDRNCAVCRSRTIPRTPTKTFPRRQKLPHRRKSPLPSQRRSRRNTRRMKLIWTKSNNLSTPCAALVADCCAVTEGISLPCGVYITLTDDREMREINRAHRGIDRATDVLSFPAIQYPIGVTASRAEKMIRREYSGDDQAYILGEIFISGETRGPAGKGV